MIILDAVQSVFTIFTIILVGYILTKKGWFNDDTGKLFSKLVTKISLPAFMITNLLSTFDKAKLTGSLTGLAVPLISMSINFLISILFVKALKIPTNKKGTFKTMFALSNTIFIGIPVCVSLFGEQSVPYVMLYYIVNTLTFWSIGVYFIKKDGDPDSSSFFSMEGFKNILTPPLMSFFVSVILILLNIQPPKFVMDSCKYIGSLTTPLSLLFIGITLTSLKRENLRIDKYAISVFMGRFIISPLVISLIIMLIPLPSLMAKVFIVEAAMPVMTQVAIVCKSYNGDYISATVLGTLSTALSLVFIPIYMVIFSFI